MNLAAYIFHQLCKSIRTAQNPTRKTPQAAYPRLMNKKRKKAVKIKQEKASEDKEIAAEVTVPEEKTATEKSTRKSTKKPMSERKKAARVQRRMIVQDEDSEETEE
ncbi:hypothetical protein A2U01_0032110, partial [Trifolium medium]|nr:hypothetical protein [Trifolium medium]